MAPPTYRALTETDAGGSSLAVAVEALLSVREVAVALRVCTATVYVLCETGELPSIRIAGRNTIRVASADLSSFIKSRRKDGR